MVKRIRFVVIMYVPGARALKTVLACRGFLLMTGGLGRGIGPLRHQMGVPSIDVLPVIQWGL